MTHLKVKKGDTVLVISGKDRGRKGKVVNVMPLSSKLVVEGINVRKKHTKPRRSGEKGQIISREVPLPVSNVKLICPKCQKATRVGYAVVGTKKVRVCKKCKAEI